MAISTIVTEGYGSRTDVWGGSWGPSWASSWAWNAGPITGTIALVTTMGYISGGAANVRPVQDLAVAMGLRLWRGM